MSNSSLFFGGILLEETKVRVENRDIWVSSTRSVIFCDLVKMIGFKEFFLADPI